MNKKSRFIKSRFISVAMLIGLVIAVALTTAHYQTETRKANICRDVRHYLSAWISQDYHTMYQSLSKTTQSKITEPDFASRFKENSARFAQPVRIVAVKVVSENTHHTAALVSYTLESVITEERAKQLRSLGQADTKPGIHVSSSKRIFVNEKGEWKMYILPRSPDSQISSTLSEIFARANTE